LQVTSRGRWFGLVLLVLTLPVLAGCSGGRDALTIYSGRTENLIGPLLQQFHDDTGINIDVRYGNSTDLALQLSEEGERSPADVFLSQSPGATGYLASKGLLARLETDVLDRVPEAFRSPEGRWVGLSARQRVLVYNSELLRPEQLPRSVFDVTRPEYAGKVAVAPTNASFQDFVSAMRQVAGDERTRRWLEALAESGAPTYANNNAVVEAVSRGEVPMGLVNHYYNYRFLAEDPSLPSRNHVFPDGDIGSLVIPSTASVLASSDKQEEAARFIEYLLSEDAQRYYSAETFEYPLAEGTDPPADLPRLQADQVERFDIDRLGGELERTLELIQASGLEAGT
jgi:iron(III) transport system substrate-binding protein